ncbi:hypothetical protein Pth03_34360 [Planotetraspora thailandica]|uniref:Uncharacterized protein n=1 Tax=Planotetraspora thailandica TaxID=487172 RepID=A0A8J3V3T8_9ACTN|nr:hypothetical protein [Planotetraspora thailandica]GII55047.1 hypothetical protein Pth03_34360 [Planotetraspora thailandica]
MDPRGTVVATKGAVWALGGGFMMSREVKSLCDLYGLGSREMYFRGRCGVLGEVHADVVVAAAMFFPAGHVRASWEGGRSLPAEEAAAIYASACHDWGRRKLGEFRGAGRLAELLAAIADGSTVHGSPLFAGWRAMPRPAGDDVALAAHLLQVLREHRGGLHQTAILAYGLDPLEATLVGARGAGASDPETGNAAVARFLQWPEPYGMPSRDAVERRARAEELTDDLAAPAYGVLDGGERAELADLLATAAGTAFAR